MSKKYVYSSLREQVYDKGAKWPLLTQLQFVTNEIEQTNKQTKKIQTCAVLYMKEMTLSLTSALQ